MPLKSVTMLPWLSKNGSPPPPCRATRGDAQNLTEKKYKHLTRLVTTGLAKHVLAGATEIVAIKGQSYAQLGLLDRDDRSNVPSHDKKHSRDFPRSSYFFVGSNVQQIDPKLRT